MKIILILGSTSPIGAALSEKFADGNLIILSGRNHSRLSEIADRCVKSGAISTKIVATDLSKSIQAILDVNNEWPIELIIDAASAASMHMDSALKPDDLSEIIRADLTSHLELYQRLSQLNGKHPSIIFISTILAIVKTQNREIYSILKRLIEIYLQKIIVSNPNTRVLIFRIGKLINSRRDSQKAVLTAEKVRHDFLIGHTSVKYGLSGNILIFLDSIHPAVLNLGIRFQRLLRGK